MLLGVPIVQTFPEEPFKTILARMHLMDEEVKAKVSNKNG